jgi:hypothetical protein
MVEDSTSAGIIRSALFVDFDNIFSGLKRQDYKFADKFANNPEQWLSWLEGDYGAREESGSLRRKILIRKCYLNPQEYWNYRPYFISSAFEVTDCPPLTAQGKTSTDIHLVMDVLDALNHPVRFDEFVIFSGDADFTPVLLRLRMNDRTTTMLSAGYVSPAYKASCDRTIRVEDFIRDALGIESPEEKEARIPSDEISKKHKALLQKMADRIYEETFDPSGIQANDLRAFYEQFDEFAKSRRWLGFNSVRKLTEAVVAQRDDLIIIEEDPWWVARGETRADAAMQLDASAQPDDASQAIKTAITTYIKDTVADSPEPVKMEYLASVIDKRFHTYFGEEKWLGAGTFKNLLEGLDLGSLKLASTYTGFVYDPARHQKPLRQPVKNPNFFSKYPDIEPLAKKIHKLTDTPFLLPEHYRLMFEEIARAVKDSGFYVTGTSDIVSNRCVEKGAPISKEHVAFVINGLKISNYPYDRDLESAEKLSEAFCKRTIKLCRSVQFVLKMEEMNMVWAWITFDGSSKGSTTENTQNN